MKKYTWVSVFKEITKWLSGYEEEQEKLIAIIDTLCREANLSISPDNTVNGLNDFNNNQEKIKLTEIDPFTFFSLFMKFGVDNRKKLLNGLIKEIYQETQLKIKDFDGVPNSQGVNAWLFPYLKHRNNEDIPTLWNVFKKAKAGNLDGTLFDKALNIHSTGFAKLTECLFYAFPEEYFPVNKQTKTWLEKREYSIPSDYQGYQDLLMKIKKNEKDTFYDLSHQAYLETTVNKSDFGVKEEEEGYIEQRAGGGINFVQPNNVNKILFGPPGTGKTYRTVEEALKIIMPSYYEKIKNSDKSNETRRSDIKEKFDELLQSGQIAFTTFHQSFGYEDFVEGIKVEQTENGLEYPVEPGVFKSLCINAAKKVQRPSELESFKLGSRRVWKMSLGDTQTDEGDRIYQECLENEYILLGYGDDLDFSRCSSVEKIKDKFITEGCQLTNQDYRVTAVNTFINKIKKGDIIVISDGNYKYRAIAEVAGDYEKLDDDRDHWFQKRSVKWLLSFEPSQPRENLLRLAFSQMTLYELKGNTLNKSALQELLVPTREGNNTNNEYVLIIDEINRGNISKIFGELITLIEPNKRKGADEALSIILPYSKKPFSVPENIHIIGTMNTADASIAKLDIALRRRFDFIEMPPKPELLTDDKREKGSPVIVDNVVLSTMLSKINERIELLYDRDHTIGHSFFMGLSNESSIIDLGDVFKKNIIPLLREYFFEDWERIHWVLDCLKAPSNTAIHFVQKKYKADDSLESLMGKRWTQNNSSDVWELNKSAYYNSASYIGVYEKEKTTSEQEPIND